MWGSSNTVHCSIIYCNNLHEAFYSVDPNLSCTMAMVSVALKKVATLVLETSILGREGNWNYMDSKIWWHPTANSIENKRCYSMNGDAYMLNSIQWAKFNQWKLQMRTPTVVATLVLIVLILWSVIYLQCWKQRTRTVELHDVEGHKSDNLETHGRGWRVWALPPIQYWLIKVHLSILNSLTHYLVS